MGMASGTGLGDLEVKSFFAAPLQARLQLTGIDAPLDLEVAVGSSEDYARLNLPRPAIIDAIEVSEPRQDSAGWHATVTTGQPVGELVLDLVLLTRQPGARQIRNYPVLLDFAPEQEAPVTSLASERRARPTATPQPHRPVAEASTPARAGEDRSYRVQRGDTLFGIARSIAGRESMYRAADAIFQANPEAFIRGDRDLLRAGADLTIPGTYSHAGEQSAVVQQQARSTPDSISVERVELTEPPTPEDLERSLGELADSDAPELEAKAEQARLQLAFSRAELETYRKENESLQNRVNVLEQRLTDMQRLLELRDAEVAALKADDAAQEQASGGPSSGPESGGAPAGGELQERPGVSSAQTAPPRQPERPEEQPGGFDRKSAVLYFGGGVVAIVALIMLILQSRESRARAEERDRLARQIEQDSGLRLPDDL